MYRGGKICMTDHFKPLWARNVPKFGIAHAMALGVSCFYSKILSLRFLQIKQNFEFQLGPWLAVEVPDLISRGIITNKEAAGTSSVIGAASK